MDHTAFLAWVKKLTEQNLTLEELISAADQVRASSGVANAAQLYQQWIQKNAGHPLMHIALFNGAVAMSDAGDLPAAKAALERAVAMAPDFFPPYINLGNVLERMGQPGLAVNQWIVMANRLGAISGANVRFRLTALKQIGRVMESNQMQQEAESILKQSLEIDPMQADVNQHYVALRLAQCEWPVVQPWEGVSHKALMRGIGPLSMSIYTDDPMLQLGAAWRYNRDGVGYPKTDYLDNHLDPKVRARQGRRRIGYVSSDLRFHAVGFIMAELFEQHDREKVEVFVYYCGIPQEDPLKERIRNAVEHWVDIREMSDEDAAARILADGVEILVDVNGYTRDARTKLFAMRPAPVIVNWLGYPGTMGSPYHHYIVADEEIIPKDHEHYYSEKVLRMSCYQVNDRKRKAADKRPTRAEVGLPETGVVFCSFNGVQKISRFTFDRWMDILKGVPNSVLWLLEGSALINDRLRAEAKKRGVAPERLVFAPKAQNPDHLARYPLADLFLDTTPYGAHVTASDALWMGVPIVTFAGRAFAARVCASLVKAAGLPELVCDSPESFVKRAIELGNNPAELRRLKTKLATNRDTALIFDTPKLTRELEGLYNEMWADFCNGKLPRPDLRNIETYMDIGGEHDHDAVEPIAIADLDGYYREQLAKRHRYAAIPADNRLWTEADIAEAEGGKRSPKLRLLKGWL